MSTILDALKKVERERESPGDRLRHEPEPVHPRSRRVSTVMIVVCAILGFGAGAGIALWRNAAPLPGERQGQIAVPAAPHIDVPAASTGEKKVDPPSRVVRRAEVAPPPKIDEDSALEPSPFAPPPVPNDGLAVVAVPAPGVAPPPPSFAGQYGDQDLRDVGPEPEMIAAVRRPIIEGAPVAPGDGEADPEALDTFDAMDRGDESPGADVGNGEDVALEAAIPLEPEETVIDTGRSPPGAPQVTLSFLQWSADPARRFAFISVDGGPSQRVREGDAAGDANVDGITPDGVRLRHVDTLFVIRPRH